MIDLRGKYIKYDETITEDVFDGIIWAVKAVGFMESIGDTMNKHCNFKKYNYLCFFYDKGVDQYQVRLASSGMYEQIKVSDILGEGWDKKETKDEFWYKKLKKGDFVVSLDADSEAMKKDFIFEVKEYKYPWIYVSIDLKESDRNGLTSDYLRLATQQEKELYLAFGKPVHINTPLPKDNASTSLKHTSNSPCPPYLGRVVHVETKEQWDFVSLKLGRDWGNSYYNDYDSNSCIRLDNLGYSRVGWYLENNYEVVCFGDWLEKTGNGLDWIEFLNHKAATDVIDLNMGGRWDDMCTGYALSYLSDKYIVWVDPCGIPTPTKKQPVLLKEKKIEIKLPVKKKVTLNMNIKH